MTNNIIKHHGDPNNAVTLRGDKVQREKEIYLPSYRQLLPVLQTSMHFCFRDPSVARGSTLFCTCGSFAEVVGYHAYQKWASYIANEVVACHFFIQFGVHSDGSHE